MAIPPPSDDVLADNLRVLAQYGGNEKRAADALGIPRSTLQGRIAKARLRGIFPPPQPEPVVEVEAPAEAPKPVFRVRAMPVDFRDMPSRRVVCIGDSHVKPGLDFQHFKWIGRYVTENRPDNVVHIGDFLDFESCEFHTAPGSATHSRRPSFSEDIAAGEEALHAYTNEVGVGEIPHDITLGNHEFRVWRFEESSPNLKDVLTLQLEQFFARYRWKTTPYRHYLFMENVGITHICQTVMQKPVGGKNLEQNLGNGLTHSLIIGHSHRYNHITVPKYGILNSITVTNVGCSMPYGYAPTYVDGAMTGYSWGIADLQLRGGRVESANFISMPDLQRRYGK